MTLTLPSSRMMNERNHDLYVSYKSNFSINQESERCLRTVDVKGITHEMRTPLTNINLSLAGLSEGTFDPELVRYFDIIERSTKKLNDLICLLLNNQEVAVSNEIAMIDLNETVADVLNGCYDRLVLKKIKCSLHLSKDKLSIFGNRANLATALHNIVINAIEAMPMGTGMLSVSSGCNGTDQYLSIADNGEGISEQNLQKLFVGKFTTKSNGMGVGLAVTKRIIESHNGSIDVASVIGQGTTFRITFSQRTIQ